MSATWTWCPMLGATEAQKMRVDTSKLGDGYTYRTVRGINPLERDFTMAFAYASLVELNIMLAFLTDNSVGGFLLDDPKAPGTLVLVTADDWSFTMTDKGGVGAAVFGVLSSRFTRSYNPLPGV